MFTYRRKKVRTTTRKVYQYYRVNKQDDDGLHREEKIQKIIGTRQICMYLAFNDPLITSTSSWAILVHEYSPCGRIYGSSMSSKIKTVPANDMRYGQYHWDDQWKRHKTYLPVPLLLKVQVHQEE
jgi:hypothetical protein